MQTPFPPFDRRTIILSSPWDVGAFREAAQRLHSRRLADCPPEEAVHLYAWERVTDEDPFDDRLPAQAQIPSPRDPLCSGTIAVFGEWIGRPLPVDWDLSPIRELNATDGEKPFRLVHPWVDGAENCGGFPLTGSTFEVLAALAAAKAEGTRAPHLLILFVGPPDLAEKADPTEGSWGNRALRDRINDEFRSINRIEMNRRLDIVDVHLARLRNFKRYLDEVVGLVTKTVEDVDQAEGHMNRFFDAVLGAVDRVDPDDVFKGLGVYDIGDEAVFFGRETAVKAALERIETLWTRTDQPRIYWVRGPSGAGKSSFLRAGLIGNIRARGFHTAPPVKLVVRTSALDQPALPDPGQPILANGFSPICLFLRSCLAALATDPAVLDHHWQDALARLEQAAADRHGAPDDWAVDCARDILTTALAAGAIPGQGKRRLVIGFDQFEEAVDLLADQGRKPGWAPLITLVLRLAEHPDVLVIATMREDRAAALQRHPDLARIYAATKMASPELSLPTGADLVAILRKPFTYVRDLVLDDDVIETLVAEVEAFGRNTGVQKVSPASLLPLIGLTLDRLYREVAKREIENVRNFGRADPGVAGPPPAETEGYRDDFESSTRATDEQTRARLSVDLCLAYRIDDKSAPHNFFDVRNAISILADEAVAEARDKSGPSWDNLEVPTLLRRLVSWAGNSEQPFSLPAADWPGPGTVRTLAEAMKARRLIVPDDGDRIRLVHEAVISNWAEARTWLEEERPLLRALPALQNYAEEWVAAGQAPRLVDQLPVHLRKAAFRMLASHYELLIEARPESDPHQRTLLRDFALECLSRLGVPRETVEETVRKPTLFLLAVFYQKIDIAQKFLEQDPGVVDIPRLDGRTALFLPAFHNDLPMMDLLLKFGAQPDAADEKGWRPIHAAATMGATEATRRLAEAGVDLSGSGAPGGTTPLHLAAAGGHLETLRYLVKEMGQDADISDADGHTPLMRAAIADEAEAVRELVGFGARPDRCQYHGSPHDFGYSPLHAAAELGATQAISVLLKQGLDPALTLRNGFTALHSAARAGHAEAAGALVSALRDRKQVIDLRAVDDFKGTTEDIAKRIAARATTAPHRDQGHFDLTPLHVAIMAGQTRLLPILLPFSDPNAVTGSGATALHLAAERGQTEIVRMLLDTGRCDMALRDVHGHGALQKAIEAQHWTTARVLLASPRIGEAASYHRSVRGRELALNVVQQAAGTGDERLMRFALHTASDRKAAADAKGPLGRTALHLAALQGHADLVRSLLEAGADPSLRDDAGLSPIHYAARRGDAVALGYLVKRVVSPGDWAKREGPSALHLAGRSGSEAAVGCVLDWGAEPLDQPDAHGFTPFHRTVEAGALASAKLLAGRGAKVAALAAGNRHSALTLATQAGSVETVDWLLDSCALPPDRAPPQGRTPLVTAMAYRAYAVAERLIRAGADAGQQDPETGRRIAVLYLSQIRRAEAYGQTDARHAGLEDVLRKAGHLLPLQPMTQTAAPTRAAPAPSDATVKPAATGQQPVAPAPGPVGPGATGLFPEFAAPGDSGTWQSMADAEKRPLLDQISPVDGKWPLSMDTANVQTRTLPFYADTTLISIRSAELDARRTRLFYLAHEGSLFRLSGTSPPIHEINARVPIRLTEGSVLDYLRFFCFFVRGEEGAFYITEDGRDPILPVFSDVTARAVLTDAARPANLEGQDSNGNYLCDAVIYYSNALFSAEFAVEPSGMVRMRNDEPIAANLPAKMDIPLG